MLIDFRQRGICHEVCVDLCKESCVRLTFSYRMLYCHTWVWTTSRRKSDLRFQSRVTRRWRLFAYWLWRYEPWGIPVALPKRKPVDSHSLSCHPLHLLFVQMISQKPSMLL